MPLQKLQLDSRISVLLLMQLTLLFSSSLPAAEVHCTSACLYAGCRDQKREVWHALDGSLEGHSSGHHTPLERRTLVGCMEAMLTSKGAV